MGIKFQKIKKFFNPPCIFEEVPFSKITSKGLIIQILFFLSFIIAALIFDNLGIIGFLIVAVIFLISFSIKSFSGRWFDRIWSSNLGEIQNNWNNLRKWKLKLRHFELFMGIFMLALFHLAQWYFLRGKYRVLAYQQGAIGVVFFLIFAWFIFQGRETIDSPKHVALTFFLTTLSIIVYDIILAIMKYLSDDPSWISTMGLPILLLFWAPLYLFNPDFGIL